jgi:uncharacterized short protein YbdD (DUF466 family)
MTRIAEATTHAWQSARWFFRGIMGADAYEKYLEHYWASPDSHGHPPMTEREFWWDRDDRRDANPEGRCC